MGIKRNNGTALVTVAGAGATIKSLLSIGSYTHATDSQTAKTTTSATLVDVDATNLKVTGSVPSNGMLEIVLTGIPHCDNNGYGYWGLRTASAIVSGTQRFVIFTSGLAGGQTRVKYLITGLTPGATFEYRFAWCTGSNTYMMSGPTYGPWTIEAWSVGDHGVSDDPVLNSTFKIWMARNIS